LRYRHAVIVLAALLAGCSSSTASDGGTTSGSSGGTTGGGNAAQVCSSYANAFCGLYQSCSNGFETAFQFGDLATCVSGYQTVCLNRLAAPNSALTASQTQACATALPDESCENLYATDNTAPCLPAQGPGAAGAACSIDAQCQSAYCAIPRNAVCGTCGPVPSVGTDCSDLLACGPGLICLRASQTCASPVGDGGACTVEADCEFGFSCLSGDGGLQVCAPAAGAGQPCDYHNLTGPGCSNREGLYCKKETVDGGSCTPFGLADAGEECGEVLGQPFTDCTRGGLCQKSEPDAGLGTCLAAATVGQPCDIDAGPPCLLLARCVLTGSGTAGVCTEPAPANCP
jgi:hypothetical protein